MIINDTTPDEVLYPRGMARGQEPRDWTATPLRAVVFPVIPRSEWSARIKERKELKSRLVDIRRRGNGGQPIPALNQNPQGYCWAYSTVGCVQMVRAANNLPYVPLSAHSVACKIKNFRDEGAWGALSMDYIIEHGVVPQSLWPQASMSRSYDTATAWAEAKKYRIVEGWQDVAAPVWNRDLSVDQVATLLLTGTPVAADFNWWGHSVLLLDWDEVEPGSFGPIGLNSWGNEWGDLGEFKLQGSRAVPDNAVAPRVVAA